MNDPWPEIIFDPPALDVIGALPRDDALDDAPQCPVCGLAMALSEAGWWYCPTGRATVAAISAAPDADAETLAALGRLAERVSAGANERLAELAGEGGPSCAICGAELERIECSLCGGTGGFSHGELMEIDPLWYFDVSWEDCTDCGGTGAHWECPNAPHTGTERTESRWGRAPERADWEA